MNQTQALRATNPSRVIGERASRVLASSIYEQLRNEGCSDRDIISVSSQLISLITSNIQNGDQRKPS